MNLKLRFALLFTLFVAAILLISSTTIYVLDFNYRRENFYERLKKDAVDFHGVVTEIKEPAKVASTMLTKALHSNTSYDEQLAILDSAGKVLNKLPDTLTVIPAMKVLEKAKRLKEYRYMEKDYQHVLLYIGETKFFVLARGYDLPGFQKMKNMKVILAVVFIGSLLLTAIISFAFVKEAIKPLTRLSTQMKFTNERNLAERVPATDEKDEINEIARSFNAMLERLHNAFAFQKNFVQHASHELRTPLASMLSQTESALNKELDGDGYRQVLLSLKDDEQRMIELTNSLLMISQYDQIAFRKDWPQLRIDELLYETVVSYKRLFPDLAVNINFTKPPETDQDFMVYGNDALLKSAFGNLIRNAYSYSFDRKVTISIDVYRNNLQLHFDNNGTQLSPEEAKKIMVAFFRGENAGQSKGFGLGLSIVQRIISIHQGALGYMPLFDDVNRFTVTLPKATAAVKI